MTVLQFLSAGHINRGGLERAVGIQESADKHYRRLPTTLCLTREVLLSTRITSSCHLAC